MVASSPVLPLTPLIDIGVNLTDKAFARDREAVIERALAAGVTGMLLTGTSLSVSREAQLLAAAKPDLLRSTAGVHPHHASSWNRELEQEISRLFNLPQVVAVGETGLDFNRNFSTPAEQERAFEAQLQLAAETGLPLFIHERDAGDRMLQMLTSWRDQLSGAVVHCFTGDRASLFGYLDLDLYLGFTGWVCDERRGTSLWPLIPAVPGERLLVETDAPWLLPRTLKPGPEKRGRNEPGYLPWVVTRLAELRQEPPQALAQQSSANALRLFNLPPGWLDAEGQKRRENDEFTNLYCCGSSTPG